MTRVIRFAVISLGLVTVSAILAGAALASNLSHPATYSGTAATGGTVEFDVSADGTSVTRFAINEVPTSCGTLGGTTTGSIPISNDSFSYGSSVSTIRFSGTFNAIQRAQGTLSLHFGFPLNCTSEAVGWTASTPTPPPTPPDTTPPQTKINSGPKGGTEARKATFRFSSSESSSTYQCKLDGKRWQSCQSPKAYRNLKVGKHTFRVRARDSAGNLDPTPAKRTWRIGASN